MAKIARLGDPSSHGGYIISVTTIVTNAEGKLVARVGDLHFCPLKGHGITPIINGSGNARTEGKITACAGSVAGCGAVIQPTSLFTDVPLEPPSNAGRLNGPAVLGGPIIPVDSGLVLG